MRHTLMRRALILVLSANLALILPSFAIAEESANNEDLRVEEMAAGSTDFSLPNETLGKDDISEVSESAIEAPEDEKESETDVSAGLNPRGSMQGDNRAASSVTTIEFGKKYEGTAGDPGYGVPDKYYRFTIAKNAQVHLSSNANGALVWDLIDSDGTSRITDVWGEFNKVLNANIINVDWYLNAGTYYLRAHKSFNPATSFSVVVTTSYPNVSFQEKQHGSDNNLYAANNIVSGRVYTGQMALDRYKNPSSFYDVDFYKLSVARNARLTLSASTDMKGIKCTLYDSAGSVLTQKTQFQDKTTNKASLTLEYENAQGDVYIAIQAGNSHGYDCEAARKESQGLYTFKVYDGNVHPTMLRLYNPNSGEHFYTASTVEKDSLVGNGWKYEGTAWISPAKSSKPVYRLYSGTDHHYTMSAEERDWLQTQGWSYEGIGWYSAESGTTLHRLYNPYVDPSARYNNSGSHHYTTSVAERDALVAQGWRYEGTAWSGM